MHYRADTSCWQNHLSSQNTDTVVGGDLTEMATMQHKEKFKMCNTRSKIEVANKQMCMHHKAE